jgi:hypothetical protein
MTVVAVTMSHVWVLKYIQAVLWNSLELHPGLMKRHEVQT